MTISSGSKAGHGGRPCCISCRDSLVLAGLRQRIGECGTVRNASQLEHCCYGAPLSMPNGSGETFPSRRMNSHVIVRAA